MSEKYILPATFSIEFLKVNSQTYQLRTKQLLPVPQEKAFPFFEDPENLFEITPRLFP